MGIALSGCDSSPPCRRSYERPTDQKNIAPDPQYFEIRQVLQIGNNLVAEIQYKHCTNFEGNKILVFKDMSLNYLNNLNTIDPHFSESKNSPFARFKPTYEGIQAAMQFALKL